MIEFFVVDWILLVAALLIVAVTRSQSRLNRAAHGAIAAAMVAGLVFTVQAFFRQAPLTVVLFAHPSLGSVSLSFDKLSLFFLGIIQCGGIASSVYGIGYLSHYEGRRSLRPTITATALLFLAMQVIVAANHAILFLVAWELMALSGYAGIVLEREKDEVQRGSFIFFAAAHVGTVFLYLMFLMLHQQTGSWEFSEFARRAYPASVITTIFWFGFIGFGMKAGFMPFHFWLPEAHPVAPSHISAALSAVMLKTGIYGLIRVITWTHPIDYFIPSVFLFISCVTAVFGIWNALAQKDLKRMLAYSSIENIGIIGIGLSLMMFGLQHQQPLLAFLGFAGALFHTLNHFVFKSLMFMSAGSIYHHYHHRDIELMGGLMKSAPLFGVLVLIGSVAICGLPPFNGFASEFLIYSGFFEASRSLGYYFPFFMLTSTVALAFVGGLAVVGFSKLMSMIFLGAPKKVVPHSFRISPYELTVLAILAAAVVALGVFPQAVAGVCGAVFIDLFPSSQALPWPSSIGTITSVGTIAIAAIAMIAVMMWAKVRLAARGSVRTAAAWGCGYNRVTPHMQYSGTSFSDDIVNISGKALNVSKQIDLPGPELPGKSSFRTQASDYVLQNVVEPTGTFLSWVVDGFKWLQSGKIQVYVTFSIVVLLLYLFLAFQI